MREKGKTDTVLRQWAMLRLIPRLPRKISTTDIWSRLRDDGHEVDVRTVQRDLEKLSLSFALVCDDHKPKGWSWMKSAEVLDLPVIDPHTALTFRILQTHAERLLPRSTLEHLRPHFERAEQILASRSDSSLAAWEEKVAVVSSGQPLTPPEVEPEVLDAIYRALLEGWRCLVTYHARRQREAQEFEVNPLGMVFRDAVTYLVCTLWHYDDVKHLALHRISRAQVMEASPSRSPEGFKLSDHVETGAFAYPVGAELRLVVRLTDEVAFHLEERPLGRDQKSQADGPGWTRLSATVQDTQQLRWWLLGFGDKLEVLEPISLREDMQRIATQLAELYAKGGGSTP